MRTQFRHPLVLEIATIFLITAVTYLVHGFQLDYYRDDWYYVLDWLYGGPGIFHEMFSYDRPLRGYLFEGLFNSFGINPLPFHITSTLWRASSGVAALLLFRLLWPQKREATYTAALLFTLFPGYLWWIEAIEYQPMVLSVFLQIVSIGLTLLALRSQNTIGRFAAIAGAVLSGWAYIGLVDYAIGMEAFRLLCIFVIAAQRNPQFNLWKKTARTLREWAIYSIIPLGYLFWNQFLFNNIRPDTDINLQLGVFLNDPLHVGALWGIHWLQSFVNVAFLSWGAPLYRLAFSLRASEMLIGLLLCAVILISIGFIYKWVGFSHKNPPDDPSHTKWEYYAIGIGGLGVFFGVAPVVMANRYVIFEGYSHYALPASLAGALFAASMIYLIREPVVRKWIVALFLFFSLLTHYANGIRAINEEKIIRDFWWQVTWRAPHILPGTTLVVNYPTINYGEDIDIAWGPANIIYYPQAAALTDHAHPIFALPLSNEKISGVWTGKKPVEINARGFLATLNYDKALVMSQPTGSACVHVMDSLWPRTSLADHPAILLTSEYSDIRTIDVNRKPAIPPLIPFGPEPEKSWCYYYQQAELALREQAWDSIVHLDQKAAQFDLRPNDPVEWLPFLQAYTHLGDYEKINGLASIIKENPYTAMLTCNAMKKMAEIKLIPSPEIENHVLDTFCN